MIQVDVKTSSNVVNFPKNLNLDGELLLTLHSEITQKTYTFNVEDEGTSRRFYKFTLNLEEVPNGEYNYDINGEETGIIRIGLVEESAPGIVEFNDDYQIVQYYSEEPSQYRLQNKELTYTDNGDDLVTPDDGYYGLKNVIVHIEVPVDEYYDNGYASGLTDGYVSGKTDGVAEQKSKLSATTVTQNGNYTREDGFSAITVNVPTGSTVNNQNKTVNIVNNGETSVTFDSGYTGLGTVGINVNVPTGHTDAELIQAYNSGITYQKSLLVSTEITANGTYTRENGFDSISVNVPTGGSISYHQLTVNISSNQLEGLVNEAVVSVITSQGTESKTYTGSSINFNILPGLNYTVSFNSVENYTSPETVSGISYWGGSSSVSGYYEYTVSPSGYTDQYFTIEAISGGTLSFVGYTNNYSGKYSLNEGSWSDFTFNSTASDLRISTLSLSSGDKVKIKMDVYPDSYSRFVGLDGLKVNVYGNIMSLGNGDNFASATTMTGSFRMLFNANSEYKVLDIVDASNLVLPATTLVNYAYATMFKFCSSLTSAPQLPATALTTYCYYEMFSRCSSLVTAPELPATTIPGHAYDSMFYKCSSLVTAPALPATTFTGTGVYSSMFNGCSSLTTAPDLLATSLYDSAAYSQMFLDCTSLNFVRCYLENPRSINPFNWLYNVSATGTFVKKAGIEWNSGTSGIPTGWTVIEE